MARTKMQLVFVVIGLAAVAASAQDHLYKHGELRRDTPVPTDGFWPTERMIDLFLDRLSEGLADLYVLDEDQMWNTRHVLKDRFPKWLKENRGELKALVNQHIEASIAGEPPTAEEVADWAARAQPLVNEFVGLVEQTTEDMREYMTYEQQVLLDGELAAFNIGLNYLNQRLSVWRDGGYDWETEWPRSDEFQRIEEERKARLEYEAERARCEALGLKPPEPPGGDATDGGGGSGGKQAGSVERQKTVTTKPVKDPWEDYVEKFIARYKLSEGQQNSAHKFLRGLQERRDLYLRRKLTAITSIEEQVAAAKTEAERQKLWVRLEELNAPLERYFQKLKDKLDTLPTRKQRREAAQSPPEPEKVERTAQKPGE